ncbi:MAG: hypothetical protein KC613_25875, partial [Myxococcales bacterium]|nr:hypothetical protein [Myxococcales bacterium]
EPPEDAAPDAEPELCPVGVDPECCEDGQVAPQGSGCKATRIECEARGGIYGADCMPRKWVYTVEGTCDPAGACVAAVPERVRSRYLEWCPARAMCVVDAQAGDGCAALPGNQICPYANVDWCNGLGEGMPCNVAGAGPVGADPPVGLCHAATCYARDDLRVASTFEGPLTRVPEVDPTPGDFTVVDDAPPRLVDHRTGLAWHTVGIAANTLEAAKAACAGLRPLRNGAEPWRLPDFFELTTLLPTADEDALLDVFGEGEGSRPWWSASFVEPNGTAVPLVLDLQARFVGLDPARAPGQVHCVHGPRPSRSGQGDGRVNSGGSSKQDRLTGITWLLPAAQVGMVENACNNRLIQSARPANTAEAASLINLVGTPRDLLTPGDATCVWGSQTAGGRWRVWPARGTVEWAADGDAGQCRLACLIGDLARP